MNVSESHPNGPAHRRQLAKAVNGVQFLSEFTPTIEGLTSAGAGTYTKQQGYFQKIGFMVMVKGYLTWTSHDGTGDMAIAGLPAKSDDLTDSHSPILLNVDSLALTGNNVAQAYVVPDSEVITLIQVPTGGGSITAIPMDSAATVIFSGWYTEKP